MDVLKPPGRMDFKASNVADAWDKWSARFRNHHTAAELKKKDADVEVAILLELAGPDALAIHRTFHFDPDADPPENPEDYKTVLAKFTVYCKPRKNTVYDRYCFWKRDQEDGETRDQWLVPSSGAQNTCGLV